jgi:hypothetical protein
VLAYLRHAEEQTVLVALNFSNTATRLPVPEAAWTTLLSSATFTGEIRSEVRLGPHQILILVKS